MLLVGIGICRVGPLVAMIVTRLGDPKDFYHGCKQNHSVCDEKE